MASVQGVQRKLEATVCTWHAREFVRVGHTDGHAGCLVGLSWHQLPCSPSEVQVTKAHAERTFEVP